MSRPLAYNGTMMNKPDKTSGITADAVALQERDEFRENGWLKVLAPAKVNLHLAIGERRDDGYHDAVSIMHALALHDVLYLRRSETETLACRFVPGVDIEVPEIAVEDNLATRAVMQLADALGRPERDTRLEIRIEKNIPAQAGLGGGSSDAAAALVGAARLWGIEPTDPANAAAIEATARHLGADVAFFLHGGCAYLEGTGDTFAHALTPSKKAIVLVKPDGGVSTAAAYRRFDEAPTYVSPEQAAQALTAETADDIALFNNLAPASEALMPELATVRSWLADQPGTHGALLCGSGAATFAACSTLADATAVAAAARARGWWSRATSLSAIRAAVVGGSAGGAA